MLNVSIHVAAIIRKCLNEFVEVIIYQESKQVKTMKPYCLFKHTWTSDGSQWNLVTIERIRRCTFLFLIIKNFFIVCWCQSINEWQVLTRSLLRDRLQRILTAKTNNNNGWLLTHSQRILWKASILEYDCCETLIEVTFQEDVVVAYYLW